MFIISNRNASNNTELRRVYFIKNFDLKTDIKMPYQLKYREIYYSENDLLEDIKYTLEDIHKKYQETINCLIDYNEFYNKFKPNIDVAVINLNHKYILNEKDYNNYLEYIKTLSKDELREYLLDCVYVTLSYDHNLNLLHTFSNVMDCPKFNEYHNQYSFSYKSLFPEKYHVNKYNDGDRVLYNGKEYIIWKRLNNYETIYESDDPLNYINGYHLMTDEGYITPDDKFGYYPVDEDLTLLPVEIKTCTKEIIESLESYIQDYYHYKNCNIYEISNINNEFTNKYDKLIRSDKYLSVILKSEFGEEIIINNDIDYDLMSYVQLYEGKPVLYCIGCIKIPKDFIIKNIIIKYNNDIIDGIEIDDPIQLYKNDKINVTVSLTNDIKYNLKKK